MLNLVRRVRLSVLDGVAAHLEGVDVVAVSPILLKPLVIFSEAATFRLAGVVPQVLTREFIHLAYVVIGM